jgi:Na+/H+ antiporter NhaD/arsenite permease-like protein
MQVEKFKGRGIKMFLTCVLVMAVYSAVAFTTGQACVFTYCQPKEPRITN